MNITYNISTPYYLPTGDDKDMKLETMPDINRSIFWTALIAIMVIVLVILVALYIIFLMINLDKLSTFEYRLKNERREELR